MSVRGEEQADRASCTACLWSKEVPTNKQSGSAGTAGRKNEWNHELARYASGGQSAHAALRAAAPPRRAGLPLLLSDALRCQAGRSRPRSSSRRRDAALHEDKKPPFPTGLK
ncbi:unnamed protein product [Coccothraustes coccothraustes]